MTRNWIEKGPRPPRFLTYASYNAIPVHERCLLSGCLGAPRQAAAYHENRAARRFVHRPAVPAHGFFFGRAMEPMRRSTGLNPFPRRNALPWISEDVIGEGIEADGQYRLSLGAEGGQPMGVHVGALLLLPRPAHCAVERVAGLHRVA